MKKNTTQVLTILIPGLLFTGIALFADVIGLDKGSEGWSRPRVAIFSFGIFLILLANVNRHLQPKLHTLLSRFFVSLQKQRIAIWFLENEAIQRALRFTRKYVPRVSIPVIVLFFYAWLASSGTWITWKSPTSYYSSLAEALLNGNLHFSLQPDPQLLALENPYDPSTRDGIAVPADLSLHNGKFYMYWGPAPSILLAIIQFFIHKQAGDLTLAFIFAYSIFLVQTVLLYAIRNRYFSTQPAWSLHLAILLGGLTGPIILLRHNYDNARIYEASIAAGQFFLLFGFLLVFSAITTSIPDWKLVFAGILWALAIGTRQILAGPIAVMIILTAFWITTADIESIAKIRKFILLGLPLCLGFICLGWYNWARFHSITETGLYYQLAGPYLQENYTELFSKSYVIQNSYNYLFNPPGLTSKFPFLSMHKGSETPILSFYATPEFYNGQPVTGLMYIFPFAVFAILPLIALSRSLYTGGLAGFISDNKDPNSSIWVSLNLVGSLLIAYSLLLGYFWIGLRFLGDFIPELMILSALGFWQGYKSFEHKHPANDLYTLFGISLACISIFTSTMMAISTNSQLINLIARNLPFLQ